MALAYIRICDNQPSRQRLAFILKVSCRGYSATAYKRASIPYSFEGKKYQPIARMLASGRLGLIVPIPDVARGSPSGDYTHKR